MVVRCSMDNNNQDHPLTTHNMARAFVNDITLCRTGGVTPQNPYPGMRQTPCTRERVPQMHKARNLSYHNLIPQKSEDKILKSTLVS
ncbi:hypothetical protein SLEP1_g50345 [Rubroshorea leprosula]|uniref:Uncharacterized protein n=1 Tax=Rubroshorea leprosula TaxID=152421 RepID=A0AAV5LZQ1_9ROSI|nr:hypothetical protein SLEP1_g50345 [Rubroshorea leprosula]